MCVLAMAWQACPAWSLVVAGNRDERHARPAAALARWAARPHVIAGRDLEGGGTWMGVSETGRFAVVTNFAGQVPDPAAPSRGGLVAEVLDGSRAADPAETRLDRYNGLSLLTVDGRRAWFATNRPEPASRQLDPGIYGLSNGALDAPWRRTEALRGAVHAWIGLPTPDPAVLLDALAAHDAPVTEEAASDTHPVFIRHPVYGTRCSTVVLVDAAGQGTIIERRFDAAGAITGETQLGFAWPGSAAG